MASETEEICPICRDARGDDAYAMPCRHRFCLGCILRWIQLKPECPICRGRVDFVQFSGQGGSGGHQYVLTLLEVSPEGSSQAGPAPSRRAENSARHPTASPPSSPQGTLSPDEQGAAEPEAVGGLLPEVWAELFQSQARLLDPVLAWLRQQLLMIYEPLWWHARRALGDIAYALCVSGPVEEALVRVLQPGLGEDAAPLARGIIDAIASQCSEEAWRLLRSPAVGAEDERPEANSSPDFFSGSWCRTGSPSSSSHDTSNGEEEAGTSQAAGGPGRPPSVPVPAEQEQPQEGLGEAAAGPSAQGCSRSPSAPRQRRSRSRGRPRRAPKRRAPGPQDSPQPCKRPPRRQH